jgi:hypothetical protein
VSAQPKVIAGGVGAILLFDLLAAVASRALAFPYARASVGSYFIYLIVGFVAARVASRSRAKQGAIAAAFVGLAHASAGWAIAWSVGPGRPPAGTISPLQWALTAAVVVLFAALVGFLGGAVGVRSRRNVTTVV